MAKDLYRISFVAATGDIEAYRRFIVVVEALEAARGKPDSPIELLATYHESIDGEAWVRAENQEAALIALSDTAPGIGMLPWNVTRISPTPDFTRTLRQIAEAAEAVEKGLA